MGTLRGSYGKGKEGVLRSLFRAGVSGQFAAIYSTFMPLDIINVHFRLRRLAKSACPRRVLQATALSLWCRAHFGTWWSLFVAGAREASCFGAPTSTFRDRCKGSELFYFEMQFSWQAQHFRHGGDRRGAQIW